MSNTTNDFEVMLSDFFEDENTAQTTAKKRNPKRVENPRYKFYKSRRINKVPNLGATISRNSAKPHYIIYSTKGWYEQFAQKQTNKIVRRSPFDINGGAYKKLKKP